MVEVIEDSGKIKRFMDKLHIRSDMDTGKYVETVKYIVGNVRETGDQALLEYTNNLDGVSLSEEQLLVSKEQMKEAFDNLEPKLKEALVLAKKRIWEFHSKQKRESWMDIKENGEILGQRILPLNRVGVYVPGGKAAYPSSVLMNVIPAKVAGVKEIVMVSPMSRVMGDKPQIPTNVLAAAYVAGVDAFYTIGGAQAIAALAFGTQTIPKVDKIVGPGNIYVALAKKEVYGQVSIDSIAGPSEILIIADESANATYVAADMLSQAEHDELASAITITTSRDLADAIKEELTRLYKELPRKEILKKSLKNYGAVIVVDSIEEAAQLANEIAPEHLELATKEPFSDIKLIQNAGAIFLGHYTPEPLGDYIAGPNHVLPTNATARFFSPLGVDDFIKKSSLLYFTKETLDALSEPTMTFANSEQLEAHALAIRVRKEEKI